MYGHFATTASSTPDILSGGDSPSPDVITPSQFPLPPPQQHLVIPLPDYVTQQPYYQSNHCHYHYHYHQLLASAEFDSLSEALLALNSESPTSAQHTSGGMSSSSSGCSICNSPSYPTQKPSLIQRSISSHNGFYSHIGSTRDIVDPGSCAVRRVLSTGDLHRQRQRQRERAESPVSSESSMIIEAMSKACRYSPEEKKEKIERYRSKRNLRNFNKKIKYACRKTLADSRPRIRGRFARNDEILEKNQQEVLQWSHMGMEEDEEDEDNWINYLD